MTKKQTTTTKKTDTKKQEPVEGDVVSYDTQQPPADAPFAEPAPDDIDAAEDNQDNSALIQRDASAVGPMIGGISTGELRTALATQTEQRELIKEFIQHHLVDGTDYGRIHVVNRDKCPDADRCKKDYHYSKAVLFKPGQEKLFSLFQITDKLERDTETYEMLPNTTNLVAYKCTLYRNGQEIGQGRGCAVVGDNRRDANATIKIAEKRARMDACLSLGFSEYFAQDLDDPDYKSQAEMANQRAAAKAEARDTDDLGLLLKDAKLPVDDAERTLLTRWLKHRGFKDWGDTFALFSANGIDDPKSMTSGQARDMIRKLKNETYERPEPSDPDTVADPDDPSLEDAFARAERQANQSEPLEASPLVVDDDLKVHVIEEYKSVGLNARGHQWFMKFVSGKPWGSFDKFTDDNWRKAYQLVQDILERRMDVDESYIAGVVTEDEAPAPVDPSEPMSNQVDTAEEAQRLWPDAHVVGGEAEDVA